MVYCCCQWNIMREMWACHEVQGFWVGERGWGLKQAHDLSGSCLATFVVGSSGEEEHWFITIKGTDQQISGASVVIGKCIAKQHVHTPQKQKTGNAVLGVAPPSPSSSNSDSQFQPPPSTLSQPVTISATQVVLTPLPAGSPMPVGTPMPTMPSLASGSLMDISSPMALSTLTPNMLSTPVIFYTFGHYSQGNLAQHSSNTASTLPLWQARAINT
ncbi:hypothetical protein C0995_006653, partial [Termitomyces sp. Mi166